jgi:hypothetical protein
MLTEYSIAGPPGSTIGLAAKAPRLNESMLSALSPGFCASKATCIEEVDCLRPVSVACPAAAANANNPKNPTRKSADLSKPTRKTEAMILSFFNWLVPRIVQQLQLPSLPAPGAPVYRYRRQNSLQPKGAKKSERTESQEFS